MFFSINLNRIRILNKLVLENCLRIGQNPKLTNKKVTRFVFGTRYSIEIFKLYEFRYLLLKVYPLIYNLFHTSRWDNDLTDKLLTVKKPLNKSIKKKKRKEKETERYLKKNLYKFHQIKKNCFFVDEILKNIPPQILFASITPMYAQIIETAAKICQMPWHKNRWLNGAITASISYLTDKQKWNFYFDLCHRQVQFDFAQRYGLNKEDVESLKEKTKFYAHSRWPSLIIIPDVANNPMIIAETEKIGIPVIGLVNSNCHLSIDYPIFAQDASIHSAHFFCHFMATLIAKEMVQIQHKLIAGFKFGILKKSKIQWRKTNYPIRKKPLLFDLQESVLVKKGNLRTNITWDMINIKIEDDEFDRVVDRLSLYRILSFFIRRYEYGKIQPKRRYFLRKRKYAFSIYNVVNQFATYGPAMRYPKLRVLQWQKKNERNKKNFYWTNIEQKKAFAKSVSGFAKFEKILQIQWVKMGRLRYNNPNKDYYWHPLRLMVQTSYRSSLRAGWARWRQARFPELSEFRMTRLRKRLHMLLKYLYHLGRGYVRSLKKRI